MKHFKSVEYRTLSRSSVSLVPALPTEAQCESNLGGVFLPRGFPGLVSGPTCPSGHRSAWRQPWLRRFLCTSSSPQPHPCSISPVSGTSSPAPQLRRARGQRLRAPSLYKQASQAVQTRCFCSRLRAGAPGVPATRGRPARVGLALRGFVESTAPRTFGTCSRAEVGYTSQLSTVLSALARARARAQSRSRAPWVSGGHAVPGPAHARQGLSVCPDGTASICSSPQVKATLAESLGRTGHLSPCCAKK